MGHHDGPFIHASMDHGIWGDGVAGRFSEFAERRVMCHRCHADVRIPDRLASGSQAGGGYPREWAEAASYERASTELDVCGTDRTSACHRCQCDIRARSGPTLGIGPGRRLRHLSIPCDRTTIELLWDRVVQQVAFRPRPTYGIPWFPS